MIEVETIFDSDREEYEFMQEKKEKTMKKYIVVAYPDDEGNKKRSAIIEAESRDQALLNAWRMFTEWHEIGVYEMEGATDERAD